MDKLSPEQQAVVVRVLQSRAVQLLIGAEEWDLTEGEEQILWEVIKATENQ